MKLCDGCAGVVPDSMLVKDTYTSNSFTGKKERVVCILCKRYLPIGHNDCYAQPSWHRWRKKQANLIRRFWLDITEASDWENMPTFLPEFGAANRGFSV